MTKVIEHIQQAQNTVFSFEVLPPLRGKGIDTIFRTIDPLLEYNPKFINITSHREQYDASHRMLGHRPATVAVAAAIKQRYNITVVPHFVCGGFTRKETEDALIELHYLGIDDVLCLRGDGLKNETSYRPEHGGNWYAEDLLKQVRSMNAGKYLRDAAEMTSAPTAFSCGIAGYPEKHYASASFDDDMAFLKRKVDAGAEFIITQMFFENAHYFRFVDACRKAGITIPIIPGLKPLGLINQIDVLPKLFFVEMPAQLCAEIKKCSTDEQAKQVGTEWTIAQAKDLIAKGVPVIHLFTYGAGKQTEHIARALF